MPPDSSAPLLQAGDGNFYGVSKSGGTFGYGTIFKLSPTGVLKIIYSFDATSGCPPTGGLVQDSAGFLYGTTGEPNCFSGYGVIYKVTTTGKFAVLHQWNGADGKRAYTALTIGTDGNLYGASVDGGSMNWGVLFRITPNGTYTVLHDFTIPAQGINPSSLLMQHTNGKIYGLAGQGAFTVGVLYSLDVGLGPFVKLMVGQGKAGQSIEILGQGFTGTSSVMFGSGPAAFTVVSDTYMTAKVPATGTSGSVTVTTPTGTLTSNTTFKVIPTLTSFNPTTGTVGTSVVLTGTALSQTSKVKFGGVKATSLTVNSATKVTAIVPVGAKTGNIVITTPGGTASKGTFTVY